MSSCSTGGSTIVSCLWRHRRNVQRSSFSLSSGDAGNWWSEDWGFQDWRGPDPGWWGGRGGGDWWGDDWLAAWVRVQKCCVAPQAQSHNPWI